MYKNKIQSTVLCIILAVIMGGCSSSRTQESTGQYIDDGTITSKVKSTLLANEGLAAYDINVKTYKGVVLLSGFVDSQQISNQAAADARSVSGVREVRNKLLVNNSAGSVKGYTHDTTITTNVKAAIVNDPRLSAFDINVKTYDGVVQLSFSASCQNPGGLFVDPSKVRASGRVHTNRDPHLWIPEVWTGCPRAPHDAYKAILAFDCCFETMAAENLHLGVA